jgi:hypothetical protein
MDDNGRPQDAVAALEAEDLVDAVLDLELPAPASLVAERVLPPSADPFAETMLESLDEGLRGGEG